jgi:hypothetical protein
MEGPKAMRRARKGVFMLLVEQWFFGHTLILVSKYLVITPYHQALPGPYSGSHYPLHDMLVSHRACQ